MKAFTVFYAWQSDSPSKVNKFFIRQALRDALDRIDKDTTLEDSPRLDYDTKDVTGIPEIARTILEKIDVCGVFVADLSIVGQTFEYKGKVKLIPNPNVMLELGYTLKSLGSESIICVMNEAFGPVESQVFDIAHRRWPITYRLEDYSNSDRKKIQDNLSREIEVAIRLMIAQGIPDRRDPVIIRDEMIREHLRQAIFTFLALFRFMLHNDWANEPLSEEAVQLFGLNAPLINGGGVDFEKISADVIKRALGGRDLTREGKLTFDRQSQPSVGETILALANKFEKECMLTIQNYAASGNPHLIKKIQALSNAAHSLKFYENLAFLEYPDSFLEALGNLFQEISTSAEYI